MKKSEKFVDSVRKALDLLDILAFEDVEHDGVRLADLSRLTGEKPTTLHAILKTMIKCGYVQQNSKQRYVIGKRCRQMGLVNHLELSPKTAEILYSQLKQLFDQSELSVSFYVLSNGERINYFNMPQKRPTKIDYSMLGEKSIYQYPSGRVLAAYCTPQELKRIIRKNGYPDQMWGGAVDSEGLDLQIHALRQEGWAKRQDEKSLDTSYSVPVLYPDGSFLGALGVYIDGEQHRLADEEEIKEQMLNCAKGITHHLSLEKEHKYER